VNDRPTQGPLQKPSRADEFLTKRDQQHTVTAEVSHRPLCVSVCVDGWMETYKQADEGYLIFLQKLNLLSI